MKQLGTVFGLYSFSEWVLGLDPQRKWTERAMGRTASVRVPNGFARALPGPSFRFRAFFINDEDQLGGMFRDPLGEAVFSLQAWDLVFESILRLRGNAVLVGTIPFIDEPSLDLAARRGLFIGQHHFTLLVCLQSTHTHTHTHTAATQHCLRCLSYLSLGASVFAGHECVSMASRGALLVPFFPRSRHKRLDSHV